MPPETIVHHGLTLTLYDPTPCKINGYDWYTYYIDGCAGLWEHCPFTGRTVRTQ